MPDWLHSEHPQATLGVQVGPCTGGPEAGTRRGAALRSNMELATQLELNMQVHVVSSKIFTCVQAGLEPTLASEAALQSDARPAADPEPDQAGPATDSHHLLAPDARPNGGTGAPAAPERPLAGPAWGDSSGGQAGSGAPSGAPAQRSVGVPAESHI